MVSFGDEFGDFCDGNLLDSIDFDDLFADMLPDLEVDPEILAESTNSQSVKEEEVTNPNTCISQNDDVSAVSGSGSDLGSSSAIKCSKSDIDPIPGKLRKSMAKNPPGKRKVKVDWTPELHRKFVQAVEQLGVDKAVPSRILQLMGIDCLTRHNVASHLQKYRSHRKHLVAREAEAARWSQRRQMYRGELKPWIAPSMGFPPLHVWGHPSFWIWHHPPRFKVEQGIGVPMVPQLPSDIYPTKETVDTAIKDVLSKPRLPLPLGLKPPSVDSVMAELQRQGISKVPP